MSQLATEANALDQLADDKRKHVQKVAALQQLVIVHHFGRLQEKRPARIILH
jgi:hypothetical protein